MQNFLIGRQSCGFFWGERRRRRRLDGVQRSREWPAGGADHLLSLPLSPPTSSTCARRLWRAASVALRVSERHIPHTSVSLFRSESVFFCMNRRETDALYQVTVFQRGRDFDLNMFLLLLLDKTSCQLASDHMCRIKLSVLVMEKGPFVFSVRFLFFCRTFSNRCRLKIQGIKEK